MKTTNAARHTRIALTRQATPVGHSRRARVACVAGQRDFNFRQHSANRQQLNNVTINADCTLTVGAIADIGCARGGRGNCGQEKINILKFNLMHNFYAKRWRNYALDSLAVKNSLTARQWQCERCVASEEFAQGGTYIIKNSIHKRRKA